jgi:DNA polymerase-3 subunit epsilon
MLPNKLVFVDIETTGTSAAYGRIIEIGILRVEDNELVKTYQTFINPETHLPPEIEYITGITQKDLEDQPTFRQVVDDILKLVDGCVFVAHNARFDYSFLKHSFLRENKTFNARQLCTVKLSRLLYPTAKHHNLDAVIERCGLLCEQRHRAFNDAAALWDFYKHTQKTFSATKIGCIFPGPKGAICSSIL